MSARETNAHSETSMLSRLESQKESQSKLTTAEMPERLKLESTDTRLDSPEPKNAHTAQRDK